MATLTYRIAPGDYETLKRHRELMIDRLRKRYGKFDLGWLLEFQRRGAAHFHFFFGAGFELGEIIRKEETTVRKRKGSEAEILVGEFANYVESSWVKIVGDTDPKFLKFQRGGIVEKMRSPDAAGRYAAKEAAKRVQKESAFPVSQWWGMSRHLAPETRETGEITVEKFMELFPDSPTLGRLWTKLNLAEL